jgi:hypothetical protein
MTADGWSYAAVPGEKFPHCLAHPRLLGDRRSFVLLCNVFTNQAYALQINAPSAFKSAHGRSAKGALLRFTTGAEVGPRSIHEALEAAGLTDQDDPIMDWRDPGAGVSRSAAASDDESSDRPMSPSH